MVVCPALCLLALLVLVTPSISPPPSPATCLPPPNISLSTYHPDNMHHFINPTYPGLRALHADPWIFVVDDFLSPSECTHLIEKARKSALGAAQVGNSGGGKGSSKGASDNEHRRSSSKNFKNREVESVRRTL